ncbi:MAG: hypothetical protein GY953_25120 [bacterium]|nr:hypothetical protein [bacterium]
MWIVSNLAFSRDAVSPREALVLLRENCKHRHHRFWPGDISLAEAVEPFAELLLGYRQTPDAWLLGLAIHHGGRLASLDERIGALAPGPSLARNHLELIRA